jgi:acetate kinase
VRVLTVNAGSSSLKLRLLVGDELVNQADLHISGGELDADAVTAAVHAMPEPDAVGHRIVHGGERFRHAVLIDPEVGSELRALADLAPLHQAKSLAALGAVAAVRGDIPHVACFDTAFHATLPAAAFTYALPADWRDRFALRRYGFHGLSHAYASRRAAEILGREELRLVSCHLGAGASVAAIASGRSVDTTMGFTPLEGLVMATRSGSVDPGLLLWLLEREAMDATEMAAALEHSAGLTGIAGTGDMREVLRRAIEGDAAARLARDTYIHRLRAAIAAMVAALGGIDALLFTGGVGENSDEVRRLACAQLGFLGVTLAPAPDDRAGAGADRLIGAHESATQVMVVHAREDLQIAREVRLVLRDAAP